MHNFKNKKNILIAPLNWGLGHATRCIPVINALINCGFNPIIASDGVALALLKKEFPGIETVELPNYKIEYPKNGIFFKLKILQNIPKILISVWKEHQMVNKMIVDYNLLGIISDNRFGVYSHKIPSIYITHQLNVLSGNTSFLSSKIHQKIIQRFNQCWVPDVDDHINLSGKLSRLTYSNLTIKYIGFLSRLEKENLPIKFPLMIILSGPEPQRSILEKKLILEVSKYKKLVLFVKGIVEKEQIVKQIGTVLYYNYMTTNQLQQAFNESETILCRSGYTSIMDLIKLNKKAFLIPTVGQYEQEYLSEKLKNEGVFYGSNQDNFKIEMLEDVYSNHKHLFFETTINWQHLFSVFEVEKS
jgi:uncharacterized protein (TIGR00661 family)